jgi:quinol monooxygenase YgiN
MIASISTVKVQDGRGDEFEHLVADMAVKVRSSEPGTLLYQLTKSQSDPNTFKFMELYKDQDALTHHGQTNHYGEFVRQAGPLLAAAPDVETLDAIV